MSRPELPTERIRKALAADPGRMTLQVARDLDVAEVEVVRAMPVERAIELDLNRWEEFFRALEELGSVTVIVSNGATTIEVSGSFGGFSTWGEFFNVQSDSLDMHIRWGQLGALFAIEKPSHVSGVSTFSFQFFDRAGEAALKVFINFGGKCPPEKAARFMALREQFRKR